MSKVSITKESPSDEESPSPPHRPKMERSADDFVPLLVSAFSIHPDGTLHEISLEQALTERKQHCWIDATITGDNALDQVHEKILNSLTLSPFLRGHLAEANQLQTPQVLPLQQAALIVMRILSDDAKGIQHTAALCLKDNLLVTFTSTSTSRKQRLYQQTTVSSMCDRELPEASSSGCAAMWLSIHLGRTTRATHRLRRQIINLLEQLDQDIGSIDLPSIVEVKNNLMRVSAVAEEQNEGISSLIEGEQMTESLNFNNLKGCLGVLLSTAGSNERMVDRLEKRIGDVRHGYDAHQQDRINRRLNVLTIFSAVFMPLTLMAGVWGMNFTNMPELHREYSYYYAISFMAAVASFMLFMFYWKGWLS